MRLSEAIRLGAMLRPQGMVFFIDKGMSCALGAAMEAEGLAKDRNSAGNGFSALQRMHPLLRQKALCPECQSVPYDIAFNITHLNDTHKWSRERIANWIESIEPKLEQEKEAEHATEHSCAVE